MTALATRPLADRYRLEEQLGGGGTAVVYRAHDLVADRKVAVKQLRPQFASLRPARRRFLREAAMGRWLQHPGIVRLLDSGEDGESAFLVMELVEGETLRRMLGRLSRLGPDVARRIAGRLAEVLDYAHQQGIIHRDLKPENVFVTGPLYASVEEAFADGELAHRIKLGDFGQARVTALASLTGTSATWGTPEYMAPEVFARGVPDPRSDLYSLGVILHESITGRLPWTRSQALARLATARQAAPVTLPPTGAGVQLDTLLVSLLAPVPERRPESAGTVAARLYDLNVPAPAPPGKCFGCGAAVESQMPLCLSCGQPTRRFGHTPQAGWTLILQSLHDDAAVTAKLLDLITTLARHQPRQLLFLTGDPHFYSKNEKDQGIALPAVLFKELDEATARELETLFRGQGLDVVATHGPQTSLKGNYRQQFFASGGISALLATGCFTAMLVSMTHSWLISLGVLGSGVGVAWVALMAHGRHKLRNHPGWFRLAGQAVALPAADALLAEATAALHRLQRPAVRSLFADVTASLYRLARQGAALPAAGRVLEAAPEIGRRLATLANRLEIIDTTLAQGSDGELMQALGRLERRMTALAGPHQGAERGGLESTRRRLEETLAQRHQLEEERDQLASTLCLLLGRLRAACQEAEAQQALGQQAPALEAAMNELQAHLHAVPPDSASAAAASRPAPVDPDPGSSALAR